MRNRVWFASLAAVALLVGACTTGDGDSNEAAGQEQAGGTEPSGVSQADITIGVATHGGPGDSFWDVVKRGAEDAGRDLGITVNYNGSGDVQEQAQFVESYITEGVDGIIVSLANPEGMRDSVERAVEAGIQVITVNSGVDIYEELGALTHVGQTETIAGEGAGKKFNDLGVSGKVLCVLHEEANVGLQQRCDGLASTFGGSVEEFNVASTGTGDIAGTLSALQDKLTADTDVAGILSLNPDIAIAARDAVTGAGREGDVTVATFDLSPAVLDAIVADQVAFAIDQQQYLQGYLPVVFLYLFNTNANTVGGGQPVLTGPGIVDASNAADVKAFAEQGTR